MPATTKALAMEQSSQVARWNPISVLRKAWMTVRPMMTGNRAEIRCAVAPGRISMATTRMAPTDSKALTTTMES